MTVSVLIPWAGDCEHRARALDWIRPQYEALGYEVVIGYGDPDVWCKADAVAAALRNSSGDVLVIADADCWSERTQEAVHHVNGGAPWAVPYRKVYRLSDTSSEAVTLGIPLSRKLRLDPQHLGGGYHEGIVGGGIVVLPRKTYEECPIDRRFVGWGGEDHSFGYALKVLAGEPVRLRGICWHFWHPKQPHQELTGVCASTPNEQLRLMYRTAYKTNDAEQMRRLIGDGMEGNTTVTIHRRSVTVDEYGDQTATATSSTVPALVAPRTSPQIDDRGHDGLVRNLTAYLQPDVQIDHDDHVTYDGHLYAVDGNPAFWASPVTGPKGIEVQLVRVEG